MQVSTPREVNAKLWRLGYPWVSTVESKDLTEGHAGPLLITGEEVPCPERMLLLPEDDWARIEMLTLAQKMMKDTYEQAGLMHYQRTPIIDGQEGPATYAMLSAPRCGMPDYGMPRLEGWSELGVGPWKGCHDVGDFHAAHWQYQNAPPSFMLKDAGDGEVIFTKVLRAVREENAKKGLLCYYSGPGVIKEFNPLNMGSVQSTVTWTRGAGWIGLAIVGNPGMTCSNKIWVQYDNSWSAGYSIAQIIRGQILLDLHEQCHNEGLGHTSGGIMNPSLNLQTPPVWLGDPAQEWQYKTFGGKPVRIPGPTPPPPPPPPPPDETYWQKWLRFWGNFWK